MNRAELKWRARVQLGSKIFGSSWLFAVLAVVILGVVNYVIGLIPYLGRVVSLLVTGPLAYGMASMFLKQARDRKPMQMGDLFNGFQQDFSGIFLLGLLMNLFVFLWSLLFLIPGVIAQLSYSMAYYIKADHPEYDWKQCLAESKRMMTGYKGDLFVMQLSFIGWYFVGALCLGVGVFWVAAYQNAATAQFYQQLKAQSVQY